MKCLNSVFFDIGCVWSTYLKIDWLYVRRFYYPNRARILKFCARLGFGKSLIKNVKINKNWILYIGMETESTRILKLGMRVTEVPKGFWKSEISFANCTKFGIVSFKENRWSWTFKLWYIFEIRNLALGSLFMWYHI